MLKPIWTTQFSREIERIKKRGKTIDKLKIIIENLSEGEPLAPKYKDHSLKGNYQGYRECHIEPDWLLIYRINDDSIIFARTGSHSDLFK